MSKLSEIFARMLAAKRAALGAFARAAIPEIVLRPGFRQKRRRSRYWDENKRPNLYRRLMMFSLAIREGRNRRRRQMAVMALAMEKARREAAGRSPIRELQDVLILPTK